MEDSELVTLSLAGDRNAFGELVERHQAALFHLALRVLRDREEAKDATQATFIKAWTHLAQFDHTRRFFSWIYRIQLNEAFNRRVRAHPHEELDPNIASSDEDPRQALARGRVEAMIADALVELSPENREVVILRHWLNFSYDEIAEHVHVPPKTVKSRLFTARQKLGEILRRRGFEAL